MNCLEESHILVLLHGNNTDFLATSRGTGDVKVVLQGSDPFNSLSKNESSHRRKPVSRKRVKRITGLQDAGFVGMTEL